MKKEKNRFLKIKRKENYVYVVQNCYMLCRGKERRAPIEKQENIRYFLDGDGIREEESMRIREGRRIKH